VSVREDGTESHHSRTEARHVARVDTLFNTTANKHIALLGFAFKADTGDTRESPTISLVRDFLMERAFVTIYDPKVEEEQIWMDLQDACPLIPLEDMKKRVTIVHSALGACKNKEAIVIATEWKERSSARSTGRSCTST